MSDWKDPGTWESAVKALSALGTAIAKARKLIPKRANKTAAPIPAEVLDLVDQTQSALRDIMQVMTLKGAMTVEYVQDLEKRVSALEAAAAKPVRKRKPTYKELAAINPELADVNRTLDGLQKKLKKK